MVHRTNLRKVGGSVMLTVPQALLGQLDLHPGMTVSLRVDRGRLVVEPASRPRYSLAELLAVSDYAQPQPAEERVWVDALRQAGNYYSAAPFSRVVRRLARPQHSNLLRLGFLGIAPPAR